MMRGKGPEALLIYSDALLSYHFHDDHPFNQLRLKVTLTLLQALELIQEHQIIPPQMATDAELLRVHDAHYLETIKRISQDGVASANDLQYGIGTEDVPPFRGMHEASSLIAGGARLGAEWVMRQPERHVVFLGGGLHHAFRGKASGFCIYNDAAVAIQYLLDTYDLKVLYIDTDAHHGDGVQWLFYDEPRVMTVSFHETGKYLFPGTGHIYERGEGKGYGTKINVPLEPFTEDDSFQHLLEQVLVPVYERFRPDVVVSQNGADAHRFDPLTHLSLSMRSYRFIPKLVHELTHAYANGRWLALGGGGYDIWRVVPRAWTYLFAEANHTPLIDRDIPARWRDMWQDKSPVELPTRLLDPPFLPIPRRKEINEKNEVTLNRVLSFFQYT